MDSMDSFGGSIVMPGLVPGIHALLEADSGGKEDVDGRDKPGHDGDGLLTTDTP
jgi:hypothetical protein